MANQSIILTDSTLLNMSIGDFKHYAQYIDEGELWELFYQAQRNREKFGKAMLNRYIVNPNENKPEQT